MPPQRADHVERVHRLDGLDERELQEAELVVRTPHQALHDARHPHRRDVEDDADARDPEMPLDQRDRVQPLTIAIAAAPDSRATEADEGDPAQRAGVHVADGPIGVVAERIDLPHRP